ncbi:unnamed protein product [Brassica rapa subsp. trilocularis]
METKVLSRRRLNSHFLTDSVLKKSIQRSFRVQVRFQDAILRMPKPPSALGDVTVPQATRAVYFPSRLPFHKKAAHIELIWLMHSTGSMKAAHQKLIIPEITEVKS